MLKSRKTLLISCLIPLFPCATGAGARAAGAAAPGAPQDKRTVIEEVAIASALQQLTVKKADYKISATDLIEITVYQEKDLSRTARIGQNGTISFPLIGTVKVGGLSVLEAEEALSGKLREYLINPQVSVFIKEYGNKHVFILGEVKKPGSYDLPTESRLTVLEAVTLAGGFTPIAAPDRTRVIRTVDGKSQSYTIEVSAITKRGEKGKDIPLEPNDVIFVPQSFF